MAGLVIPLGLDVKAFDKGLKDADRGIKQLADKLTGLTTGGKSKIGTQFFDKETIAKGGKEVDVFVTKTQKAKSTVEGMKGTLAGIKDTMQAIVIQSNAINLKNAQGEKQAMKMFATWAQQKTELDKFSISWDKLYQMKKRYEELTGKTPKLDSIKDVDALAKNLKYEEEFIKLLKEEQKQKDILARKSAAEAEAAQKRLDAERARATAATTKANQFTEAAGIASPAMQLPAASISERTAKINALKEAQAKLNLTNEAGRKKFAEMEREIIKNQKEIDKLKQSKERLSNTANQLTQRLAMVFSLGQIRNFAMNVITIGGELEKQRIALGSIVGDISKANILFSQLKQQALDSPFTFKHLIEGTRQLAAYNIEYEKLYDTQFMLSELSAGLGVEMNRLVLAYGQVKAATVLRGQELRQFTEAGIPIIQALADKFTALEGKVVSTGEVFARVSERMVSFEMVNDVLADMTKEGGKFYDMQGKMAETVSGQWSNVRDSIEIMYMEIANQNNGILMGTIKLLREVVANWRTISTAINIAGVAAGVYFIINLANYKKIMAQEATYTGLLMKRAALQKSLSMMKFAGIGALIAGVTLLVAHLITAAGEMARFRKSIDEINNRALSDIDSDSDKLKTLISQLKGANEGSEAFKKIREEIISQYGQYMPKIISEVDGVEQIAGMYEYATESMKAYYAERALQESMAKLKEDKDISSYKEKSISQMENRFRQKGFSDYEAKSITSDYFSRIETAILSGEKIENYYQELKNISAKYGREIPQSFLSESNIVLDRYANMLDKKLGVVRDSNMNSFGSLSESIKTNLEQIISNYQVSIDEIEDDTSRQLSLDKLIAIDEVAMKKKMAEIAAKTANAINAAVIKNKGDTLITLDGIFDFKSGKIKEDLVRKVLEQVPDSVSKDIIDGLNKKINNVSTAQSPIRLQIDMFFTKLNEQYKKQAGDITKLTDSERKAILIKDDAAKSVRNLTSNYQSLTETYALVNEEEKQLEENIKRQDSNLNKLKLTLKSMPTNSPFYAATKESIDKSEQQNEKLKEQLVIVKMLIEALGLVREPVKTKKENPELEEARKLTSVYKEVYEAYKKYREYKDDEFSSQQSVNELMESYLSISKEIKSRTGIVLPNLSAIKSQEELIKRIETLLKGNIFKTKGAKSILEGLLIGIRGGVKLEAAKSDVEKLKKEAENIFDKMGITIPIDVAEASINDIITQLKVLGTEGGEAADEFMKKLGENKGKALIKGIADGVKKTEDKYALGEEIRKLFEETGVDLSGMFKDYIIDYKGYLQELKDEKLEYDILVSQGNIEAYEKSTELDERIKKEQVDLLKFYATESAKIRGQMATEEDKIAIINENRIRVNNRIKEIGVELSKEQNAKNKKLLEAELQYRQGQLLLLDKQETETRESLFRTSQMYQDLYGDIERFGTKAYETILTEMEKSLKMAKPTGEKDKFEVSYFYVDDDGLIKEEKRIINAKDLGKALADIDKKQRSLLENEPFGKIRESFSKLTQTISKDGKAYDVFNWDELGEGISLIGKDIEDLAGIFDSLGFSDEVSSYVTSIGGGITAIGSLIQNPANIGAWVQLFKSATSLFDIAHQRKIKEYEEKIGDLDNAYSKLGRTIQNTIGGVEYDAAFAKQVAILEQQQATYTQMAKEYRDTKFNKTENEKLAKDAEKKAQDAADQLADLISSRISEFGTQNSEIAQQFADAWVNAFLETGDGLSALDKSFEDFMKKALTTQIRERWMEQAINPLTKMINDAVGENSAGGLTITPEEIAAILAAKETSKKTIEGYNSAMEELFNMMGINGEFKYDTLQKGIQGITESSAQIIASYMNSVRMDVANIRMMMDSSMVASKQSDGGYVDPSVVMKNLMTEYLPQYLTNLIAIKENTSYLKEAYDPSKRGFRMS